MIIERPKEAGRIRGTRKWVLVYGRRKTGKTFLVENFVHFDEYFFVKGDRTIISKNDNKTINYDTFIEITKRALRDGKTVVVDEFHKLGRDFLDFLHYTEKEGKLILISSTLFLSKKLFSARSPLLGFFAEIPIWLIDLNDCLNALKKFRLGKKETVELAVLLREPIAIEYFDEKEGARKTFAKIVANSIRTVPALVGEIFAEEERSISAVYEGILRAIATGKIVSGEISSYLFSRKIIKKNDPSGMQQYLSNLVEFGIIKKIEVYGKNKYIYKHTSPLAKIFYYADEKYNISERNASEEELERIIGEILPRIIEDNMREFFADKSGLKEAIVEAGDFDADACLLRFRKPEIVAEIKWKEKVGKEDILKAEQNLGKINARKKILFVPDKKNLHSGTLEIMDAADL